MYKLVSKEIIPQCVLESILSTERVGMEAFKAFVENRLVGDGNMWDRMTKFKLKAGSEVLTLKATSSLFTRILVIARSSRYYITWRK